MTFYYPIVPPLGMVGNILTLVVLAKRPGAAHSCHVYMTALAVFDLITLLNSIPGKDTVEHWCEMIQYDALIDALW